MAMTPETLVVIPTYNEAGTIRAAITGVLESSAFDVLVVDDDSPDGTARIAGEMQTTGRVHLVSRESKQGLGGAYVAGFNWGMHRDYRRFVEMDADLSHDPAAVSELAEEIQRCDLAIGSRYVPGGRVLGWSPFRLALSRAGNLYVRAALGLPVRDSTSGFRCFKREVLEKIDPGTVASEGYAFQVEMAYRAWRLGFRIREVPITFQERRAGASKMTQRIVAEALVSVARWGLSDLVTGRRFRPPPCK